MNKSSKHCFDRMETRGLSFFGCGVELFYIYHVQRIKTNVYEHSRDCLLLSSRPKAKGDLYEVQGLEILPTGGMLDLHDRLRQQKQDDTAAPFSKRRFSMRCFTSSTTLLIFFSSNQHQQAHICYECTTLAIFVNKNAATGCDTGRLLYFAACGVA